MKKLFAALSIFSFSLSIEAFAQENPYRASLLESPIYKATILGVQAELSAKKCVFKGIKVSINPETNINEFLSNTYCYAYNEGERELVVDVQVNGVAADGGSVITEIKIDRQ